MSQQRNLNHHYLVWGGALQRFSHMDFAEIDRPSKCEVEYLDYNGNKKILRAEGLLATCIQHEMDHLEGILFIDYLSKLKKSMIIKKLSKVKSTRIVV